MKVYSQAGGIFMGEKPIVSLGARGKFNVLECDFLTITRVCRSSMPETRGLGMQVDSMQFNGNLLSETLGGSAPEAKRDRLAQDDRDGCPGCLGQTLDRERWTPATEGTDAGNCHHSRMAGQFRRADTLDRRRKDDHERSDEGSQGVKTDIWLKYCQTESGVYDETPRWFAKSQRLNQNVNEGRKRLQRVPVTSPTSWRLNYIVQNKVGVTR